jgi:hypothetical protein
LQRGHVVAVDRHFARYQDRRERLGGGMDPPPIIRQGQEQK